MHVIEATNLAKRYGRRTVLHDATLRVPRGSIYALLGPNGAGKTTALKLLTGLAFPSHGRILIDGQDARRPAARRHLGALIEAPALYAHLGARAHLDVYARDLRASRERRADVLAIVGLSDVDERPVSRYSLGMRQRLGIALALLGQPHTLILDEPQNGLDPQGMRDMRDLLVNLHARGHTLLVSSHLLSEMQHLATHVGLVAYGRVIFDGPLDRLLGPPAVHVETNDASATLRLLADSRPEILASGVVRVHADAATVARRLVTSGVDVRHLETVRPDLEARYFALTRSAATPDVRA